VHRYLGGLISVKERTGWDEYQIGPILRIHEFYLPARFASAPAPHMLGLPGLAANRAFLAVFGPVMLFIACSTTLRALATVPLVGVGLCLFAAAALLAVLAPVVPFVARLRALGALAAIPFVGMLQNDITIRAFFAILGPIVHAGTCRFATHALLTVLTPVMLHIARLAA
jgi:pilus assembly protein TadC